MDDDDDDDDGVLTQILTAGRTLYLHNIIILLNLILSITLNY